MKPKIAKSNLQDIYELGSTQKGILFHYLKESDENLYNVQIVLNIDGTLDIDLLKNALVDVRARHDALRSVFNWEDTSRPLQIVLKEAVFSLELVNLRDSSDEERENNLEELLKQEYQTRFELWKTPIRFTLYRLSETSYVFSITHHHILYDGWSTGVILQEIWKRYDELVQRKPEDERLSVNYKGVWSKTEELRKSPENQQFWLDYLGGIDEYALLTRQIGNAISKPRHHAFSLETKGLQAYCINNKVTPAAVLYGAYGLLLQKYLRSNEVVFGTTVSGRDERVKGIERVVGNFVNTIPMVTSGAPEEPLNNYIQSVNRGLMERSEFGLNSYFDIKQILQMNSSEDLFDSVMVIENYPLDDKIKGEHQGFNLNLRFSRENTGLPLMLTVYLDEDARVEPSYDEGLFTDQMIQSFSGHFTNIINAIVNEEVSLIGELDILANSEKEALLQLNPEIRQTTSEDTILDRFEAQVKRTPDQIAITSEDVSYTYSELQHLVNTISYNLSQKGVTHGDLVALMIERDALLIPSIYGILKAGAYYMPIDPATPVSRVNMLLEDANPTLLVSRKDLLQEELKQRYDHFLLEDLSGQLINEEVTNSPELSGSDKAYVIYTSGSTGKPKGVLVSHDALTRITETMDRNYPLTKEGAFLLKTNHVFDVSVAEIFGWFHDGGKLAVLPAGQESDPVAIIDAIQKEQVTHINFVPSMFSEFLGTLELENDFINRLSSLNYIFVAGEVITPAMVQRYQQLGLTASLVNLYGPTEATIYSSVYPIDKNRQYQTVPIGSPLDHVELFVLDSQGHLVPKGIPGELHIGGLAVAEGYLNNPELTNERFIQSNYATSKTLYKTGDLVKINEEDQYEFLGRIDTQVKVRGFRVELGDIESQLSQFQGINRCSALVWDQSGDKHLVAYYEAEKPIEEPILRNFLMGLLPAYMVPQLFIHLTQFPLTPTGKLDRKRLPSPDATFNASIVPPKDDVEKTLIDVWRQVLESDREFGVETSFFEIGGHSLKAISLVNQIHKKFGVRLTVADVFSCATIREQAKLLGKERTNTFFALQKSVSRTYYPISSAQRRLYFIYEFDKNSLAYNMPQAFEISGTLDENRLLEALNTLVSRHEGLRTSFELIDGEPMQKVHNDYHVTIETYECAERDASDVIKAFIRPFKLDKHPPFRVGIVHLSKDQSILLMDVHHIIGDGVSNAILTQELTALYQNVALDEVKFQYRDFSEWQLKAQEADYLKEQRAYWGKQFADELEVAELPTDHTRPAEKTYHGDLLRKTLDKATTNALRALAESRETTPFVLMLAIYKVFISKLVAQKDIVVGTPVAGRSHTDLEGIIGMFVNMLPLRSQPSGKKQFSEFLKELKSHVLEAIDHSDYQYEDLIDHLGLERDTSRNPLFDLVFMFQNLDEPNLELDGVTVEPYDTNHRVSKFDLTLTAFESKETIDLELIYATDLFAEETISSFLEYLQILISEVIKDPEAPIGTMNMISQEEKQLLLHGFNDTVTPYADQKTLVELFEEQVQKTPDNIVLTDESGSITYRELNARVNQLAHHLRSIGVQRNEFVCIVQNRSIEMVVSVLGVVKSGAAYVGLEPVLPDQRINYILTSLDIKVVLTDQTNVDKVSGITSELDFVNQIVVHASEAFDREEHRLITIDELSDNFDNPTLINEPQDNAYAIFTSGSTGKPKGVLVKHQPVINLIEWVNKTYQVNETDRLLFVSSISFDLSVYDMFGITAAGGSLVIVPNDRIGDSSYLLNKIYEEKVTFWDSAPAVLNQLPHFFHEYDFSTDHCLRLVFLSGDWIPLTLAEQMYDQFPGVHVVGLGGATEATIWSNYFDIGKLDPSWNSIPYGKPIQNARYYILDEHLQPCPFDVAGDLYIGGNCLATCYLNEPALSAKKFIDDPYNPDGKMYATGDLATWHRDGNMEFLGRRDFQVKVNGYRIELGEIESVLKEIPAIKDTIAIMRTDETQVKSLVAYYVSEEEIDQEELKSKLGKQLPTYMVPANLVHLDTMPLNANGKIDRKALPVPQNEVKAGIYVAPTGEVEELLQAIWEKVLNKQEVSVTANFFELGGDSIKTILVSSQARKYGYALEIRDIYQSPTIKGLAPRISRLEPTEEVEIAGQLLLSPIQSWFFDQVTIDPHYFHQVIKLQASEKIDAQALEMSLNQLGLHHDGLRTGFRMTSGGVEPFIRDEAEYKPHVVIETLDNLSADEIESAYRRLIATTDLEKSDLFQAILLQGQKEDQLVLMAHHLIIDNLSWSILLEDLGTLYDQNIKGDKIQLPIKTSSVTKCNQWLHDRAQELEKENATSFWNGHGKDLKPIPRDMEGHKTNESDKIEMALSQDLTSALLTEVNKSFNTEINDVLLCGLSIVLKQRYQLSKVQVALEGHGRDVYQKDVNLSRTMGWFTNLYPVVLSVDAEDDLSQQLCQVKEDLRQYKQNGINYGILKYLGSQTDKNFLSLIPEPQISFNYIGQLDGSDQVGTTSGWKTEIIGLITSEKQRNLFEMGLLTYVKEGRMHLNLEYDTGLYKRETIEGLLDEYGQTLEKIVTHCLNQRETVLTPSDLTFSDISLKELQTLQANHRITDILPLTPLQEGVLFHHLNDQSSMAYVEQFVHKVNMVLDIPRFKASLIQLFKRHELLRSKYLHKGFAKPMAIICDEVDFELEIEDLQGYMSRDQETIIREFRDNDRIKGFDLASDCLLRLKVFNLAAGQYTLVWTFHHIMLDAWSLDLLFADLSMIYPSMLMGTKPSLPEPTPFKSYIDWITEKDAEEQAKYWLDYLADYGTVASLPQIEEPADHYKGAVESLQFSKELTSRINDFASNSQITVSTFMQCIWAIALAKYNGLEDVVFGSVVSGRNDGFDGIENIVGLLINTIPVRIRPTTETAFTDLVKRVQHEAVEGFPYHYTSLAEIQANSELNQQLIDNILVFENAPIGEVFEDGGQLGNLNLFKISDIETVEEIHYNLGLIVVPGKRLTLKAYYNASAYSNAYMTQTLGHLQYLIEQVLDKPSGTIADLELVNPQEKLQLKSFSKGIKTEMPDLSVIDLFEESMSQWPELPAVEEGGKCLTYQELNNYANMLALELVNAGVRKQQRVAIMCKPGIDLVAGKIAIMKLGAVYIPISADTPEERVAYVLKDSEASLFMVQKEILSSQDGLEIFDTISVCPITGYDPETSQIVNNPRRDQGKEDITYIIYTSGSTGNPKGVEVRDVGLMNSLQSYARLAALEKGARTSQIINVAFDVTALDLWPSLTYGCCVCFAPEEARYDPLTMQNWLVNERIEVSLQVTVVAEEVMKISWDQHMDGPLRFFGYAGDQLRHYPDKQLPFRTVNIYGPTEDSIWTTCHEMSRQNRSEIRVIGKPIDNKEVLILDQQQHEQPVGIPGELYIAGSGLAKGYLNKPERTKQSFLEHPFDKNQIVYRTGDRARWLPNGTIEFLGRIDNQVKVRGFRIELGEIESHLQAISHVDKGVVVVQELNGDKHLTAYVVAANGIDRTAIRKELSRKLPAYMIPSFFIELEAIPLNSNGKLDQSKLPLPQDSQRFDNYIEPEGEIQQKIVKIWSDVLGCDPSIIGVESNFFDLGGHSLKAMEMINGVEKALNFKISLQSFFTNPTVSEIDMYFQLSRIKHESLGLEENLNEAPLQTQSKITI